MKKDGEGIIEEINNFLEYLVRNNNDLEKIKEENLVKEFGQEKFYKIFNLCFGELGLVGRQTLPRGELGLFRIKITNKGLKSLEEYQSKAREDENKRLTLFLTSILVITTIASLFRELGINIELLTILYGIFALLIFIYFKKSKTIKF